jgi:lactate dehydrogenase-like 2-hydroxyacid dehydrogenase
MVMVAYMTTPKLELLNYGKYNRWALTQELGAELGLDTMMVNGELPEAELVAALTGVQMVIPLMAPQGLQGNIDLMPLPLARQLPALRLVQLLSAGSNELDIPGLAELGIAVANNGGANAIPVSVAMGRKVIHAPPPCIFY